MSGRHLRGQAQSLMYQAERLCGERSESVEEPLHRLTETIDTLRPTVRVVLGGNLRIDEVEHLFVVSLAFCEFTVVPAEHRIRVAPDRFLDMCRGVEELVCGLPGLVDQVVQFVTFDQKEPMIGTSSVESPN